ncbi:MAG: hypothetical protein IJT85_04550 [Ruminococcus sp.]|nr:hypothetical protein [Ruminococcus sp.]
MDSENMKRVGLYLDKDLVKRADDMVKQFHFKSRNEFFAAAVENYIADYLLGSNESAVSDKLGKSIAKYSEDNAKAISKGLFRYAVQLEMMCRVLAIDRMINKDVLEGMRYEAINNVRRTRGKVRFEEILDGYYDD